MVIACMYKKQLYQLVLFMKPRIWAYILGIVGNCLSSAGFGIAVAFILKDMFNAAVKGRTDLQIRAVIIVCVSVAGLSIISTLTGYLCNWCVKKTMAEIRLKLYEHITGLPMAYYENHHSGDILSRMTNDIHVMEGLYSGNLTAVLTTLFRGVGCSASLFILEWRIALIVIIIGAVSAFINTRFMKPLHVVGEIVQKQQSTIVSAFKDMLAGLQVIKLYHAGEKIAEQFDCDNNKASASMMKQAGLTALLSATNNLLGRINFISIVLFGIFLLLKGLMDFGSIIAMVELAGGINAMFLLLGGYIAGLQTSFAGAERIFELLEEIPESERYHASDIFNSKPGFEISGTGIEEAGIEADNVSFAYEQDRKALEQICMSIRKGWTAFLVGPSGSGKSTVLKLLQGFYPYRQGVIKIFGRSLEEYKLEQLRDLISYIPQDAYLFSTSIEDNIGYGRPGSSREDVIRAAKMANAHDFIMEQPDGYETILAENGINLSGGQKQRIAIARAILKDAPILLLDEATSALDNESERLVQNALENFKQGRTVIIVTHRLSTIKNPDMIYVISEGKVMESGGHMDLTGAVF